VAGEVEIRVLEAGEVEELVGWAALEGWNPGHGDAAAFRSADPDGFFGCFIDGRLAAGISAVRYGSGFGFIGLYICHPEFRGRGLGRQVWAAGMAHLEGRVVGLDGVIEQQANYGRMGFVPSHDTVRWSIDRMPALPRSDASSTGGLLPESRPCAMGPASVSSAFTSAIRSFGGGGSGGRSGLLAWRI
jgi:GNAT superfamily N-acetyltransferase